MRYIYLFLLIVLVALFLAFAVVNGAQVQVNFPFTKVEFSAPLFLVMLGVYVLGMFTGGTFFGFLRRTVEHAAEKRER